MSVETMIPFYRRRKKIKQAKMACELSVSPSYLCKVEKGTQTPTESFKVKCAQYLGEAVEDVFPKKVDKRYLKHMREEGKTNLWHVRLEKSIKQNDLAKMLGCSPSYLSKVEKGQQVPSESFRKRCARILKVKEAQLFELA